jgi:hypothetical protein
MVEAPQGFALETGDGERRRFSEAEFLVKASADTTGGSFSIVESPDAYARMSARYGINWLR